MGHAKENKREESGVREGQVMENSESVRAEAVNDAVEELEKSAEDWINQLPETLQDEP